MSKIEKETPYIVLGEVILGLMTNLTSIVVFSYLLVKYMSKKSNKLLETSPTMIAYIVSQIIASISILIYWSFIGVFWRGQGSIYDAKWMYYTGMPQTIFTVTRVVFVFVMGIDRILCIQFPFTYIQNHRLYPIFFGIVCSIGIIIFAFFAHTLDFPSVESTECFAIGCLQSVQGGSMYAYLRYFLSSCNIIVGMVLFFGIRKLTINSTQKHKNNKIVLITLLITIIFELIPHGFVAFLGMLLNVNISALFGPYATIFASFESFCCAILYWNIFKKLRHGSMNNSQPKHYSISPHPINVIE